MKLYYAINNSKYNYFYSSQALFQVIEFTGIKLNSTTIAFSTNYVTDRQTHLYFIITKYICHPRGESCFEHIDDVN